MEVTSNISFEVQTGNIYSLSLWSNTVISATTENFKFFVDVACFANGSTGWAVVTYDRAGTVSVSACKLEGITFGRFLDWDGAYKW